MDGIGKRASRGLRGRRGFKRLLLSPKSYNHRPMAPRHAPAHISLANAPLMKSATRYNGPRSFARNTTPPPRLTLPCNRLFRSRILQQYRPVPGCARNSAAAPGPSGDAGVWLPARNKTKPKVRTLLRHAPTGQYFQSLNRWTLDREDAHDFGLIARALRFAHRCGQPGLELVLFFDSPDQVTAIPFEKFRLGLSHSRRSKLHS